MRAVYLPEMSIDLEKEAMRVNKEILDRNDNVNIFISHRHTAPYIVAKYGVLMWHASSSATRSATLSSSTRCLFAFFFHREHLP